MEKQTQKKSVKIYEAQGKRVRTSRLECEKSGHTLRWGEERQGCWKQFDHCNVRRKEARLG